jgi:hypothetical protein
VIKLVQALYGMKQAGRAWNACLNEVLTTKLGFERSQADTCLYSKQGQESMIWIAIFVDDILQVSKSQQEIRQFQTQLATHFDITSDTCHWILGIHIQRDWANGTMQLSQRQYIENLLDKFNLQSMKEAPTPDTTSDHLEQSQDNEIVLSANDKFLFQQIVGALIYLSVCTRPDIANAVRAVAMRSAEPTNRHLTAAKRILRYIKGTIDHVINYSKSEHNVITAFTDASWGENKTTRKSTTGYVIKLANGPISWKSKTQSAVTLSTCEAEYTALATTVQELVYILQLTQSAKIPLESYKAYVFEDNQGAIFLANNQATTNRSKHIDIKLHFVREVLQKGHIILRYCPTNHMIADLLTKALPSIRFKHLATQVLGITKHDYVFLPDSTAGGGVSSNLVTHYHRQNPKSFVDENEGKGNS